MCQNYDDPCDNCMGIAEEEEQCFLCNKYDCICDELTDAYLENRIDIDDVFQEPTTGS